jgi:hypothetical protein
MGTFASLMDFAQSALFLTSPPSFEYYYLFVHSSTISFFGRPLSRHPWALLLNTWLTFLLLSILSTWPIQFNRLILTNDSISKSPNSCSNSLLYRFLHSHLLSRIVLSYHNLCLFWEMPRLTSVRIASLLSFRPRAFETRNAQMRYLLLSFTFPQGSNMYFRKLWRAVSVRAEVMEFGWGSVYQQGLRRTSSGFRKK